MVNHSDGGRLERDGLLGRVEGGGAAWRLGRLGPWAVMVAAALGVTAVSAAAMATADSGVPDLGSRRTAPWAGPGRPRAHWGRDRDRLLGEAPGQEQGATLLLPLVGRGPWSEALRRGATARAVAATALAATAAAQTSTAAAASPSPSPTPSASASPSRMPTASPSPTATTSPTATAPASPSTTASPSATSDTPTPGVTNTPAATATDPWPATPGPTPTVPDPDGDALRPAGADAKGEVTATFDDARQTYRLQYLRGITIAYEIDMSHPDNRSGRLAVREASSNRFPVAGGGLYYYGVDGRLYEPRLMSFVGRVTALDHSLVPGRPGVAITVTESLEGVTHRKAYTLTLVGRSLMLRASSLDGPRPRGGAYVGFTTGAVEGSADGVNIRVPFMDSVPVTMLDHRWFVSTLLDYSRSAADGLEPRGPRAEPGAFVNEVAALYGPDTAGMVRPVKEVAWVTVSPELEDTFVAVDAPPSPHAGRLAGRVLVRLDGGPPQETFGDEADYLAAARELRMTDLLVVKENWHDPEIPRPAQDPPDRAAGGREGWRRLVDAAGALAPALDYSETRESCPPAHNPLYRPEDRVVHADGSPKQWPERATICQGGTTAPHFVLPPDAALRLALTVAGAPEASAAAYLEAAATWNPAYPVAGADGSVLDRSATTKHPVTIAGAVTTTKLLLAVLQRSAGPTVGPGPHGPWELGYAPFYAGYLDAITGELVTGSPDGAGGSRHVVVPDYALANLGPAILRFGMGAYPRFFDVQDPTELYPLSEARLDAWRAASLAYGNGGGWSARPGRRVPLVAPAGEAKEYFLMRAMAGRYLAAGAARVAYVTAVGAEMNVSAALKADADLAGPRLHITYEGGPEVWVNRGAGVWPVTDAGPEVRLPTNGWLFVDWGAGVMGYSALSEGRQVDYLQAPEWTLMDGRGEETVFPGGVAKDLVVRFRDGAVLMEAPDGSLAISGP